MKKREKMIDLRDESTKNTTNSKKYGNLNIPGKLKINSKFDSIVIIITSLKFLSIFVVL